ncbi:hypothetical protein TELCIR_06537 [Teladorsagia circumcincta]|uniref:Uncharacterized protein n=1 Tax=Teladorsagia circumcincta TaxID=45464 RepID=A0A2G9UPC3_TELCI|nr:hypothetical protein TELCIR_06537 [Teladorsagia circumcincta]
MVWACAKEAIGPPNKNSDGFRRTRQATARSPEEKVGRRNQEGPRDDMIIIACIIGVIAILILLILLLIVIALKNNKKKSRHRRRRKPRKKSDDWAEDKRGGKREAEPYGRGFSEQREANSREPDGVEKMPSSTSTAKPRSLSSSQPRSAPRSRREAISQTRRSDGEMQPHKYATEVYNDGDIDIVICSPDA